MKNETARYSRSTALLQRQHYRAGESLAFNKKGAKKCLKNQKAVIQTHPRAMVQVEHQVQERMYVLQEPVKETLVKQLVTHFR